MKTIMKKILLIEDEKSMARGIRDALVHHGFDVNHASNGETGLDIVRNEPPDLIVLDIMLPGIDGFEVCRQLRERGFLAPIIMLTARSEEIDKVVGLEIGADDYVTKPFSMRELLARIKGHLRRTQNNYEQLSKYTFGNISVDFKTHKITKDGETVKLTSTEYALLHYLVKNRNSLLSRDRILNEVWGYDVYPDSRIVDTHILNLRKKLEKNPHHPEYIMTHHGIGYKFVG
jgi:DNA-binding response OmpR family regulator